MQRKGLSQEGLKLIACGTMLLDHIGATLVLHCLQEGGGGAWMLYLYYGLRVLGRIAFPIYCFLLVEGAYHTRNPKKYGLRLAIGVLLAEIPFDMAFSYRGIVPDWSMNSVMLTLLLGFGMIECMKRTHGLWQYLLILPFYALAELLYTDYSGLGILVIAAFFLTRGRQHEKLLRVIALGLILSSGMKNFQVFGIWINVESFAVLALIPIFCYDGRKLTRSKAAQWAFYLFYPVHMLILALLENWIFG